MTTNHLKLIAALTMLADHIGIILFPDIIILRIIGRISFPLYAFLIGEGCRYTKNKIKYFLNILATFLSFQIVHFLVEKEFKLCVLFGFLLTVLFSYLVEWGKENWNKRFWLPTLAFFTFFILSIITLPSYSFFSFTLPCSSFLVRGKWERIGVFAILLFVLGFCYQYQMFALFALIPLALYNGKKGRKEWKRIFYIFYPAHYAVLGIAKTLLEI